MLQSDSTLPIERAKMRVRVIVPAAAIDGLRERLLEDVDKLEHEDTGEEWSGVGQHRTPPTKTHISADRANRSREVPCDIRTS